MINQTDFKNYVDKLYQIDSEFDATQTDRLTRHRHLEPESAQFLASLIISNHATHILEIGTSTGYSTLWLAYALAQLSKNGKNTAKLASIELDNQRLLTAKNHLLALQLSEFVTLQQADAKEFLAQSQENFDMIFLDAERAYYGEYVADFKRLLQFDNMLIVDNVVSHASEVTDFLAEFEKDSSFLCTTLPIGAGLFMAVKQT